MSLKTKRVTLQPKVIEVTDKDGKVTDTKEVRNRDTGKSYLITEMPVLQADNWANRVLTALCSGGIDVRGLDISHGLDTSSMGGILQLANLAIQGFGNLKPYISQPLLDELIYKTVKFIPSGGEPRTLDIEDAGDVEEVTTLWFLRKEAFNLHVDFFAQDES